MEKKKLWIIVGSSALVIVVILAIALPVTLIQNKPTSDTTVDPIATTTQQIPVSTTLPDDDGIIRVSCPAATDEENCQKYAWCVWREARNDTREPSCLMRGGSNYITGKTKVDNDMDYSFDLELKKSKTEQSLFGDDFQNVLVELRFHKEEILQVRFSDKNNPERYQVPIFKGKEPEGVVPSLRKYAVNLSTEGEPFNLEVVRKSTAVTLFNSNVANFVLSNKFIQISTKLPSKNVYGVGENAHRSFRHDFNYQKWALFSRDEPPRDENTNLYGVHPYYTCLEETGESHGVLFVNSNAMEFEFGLPQTLTFRSTGGILDMYFFLGDNPEHLTRIYTTFIGKPMVPPVWGLGFQLSRYGYNTLEEMEKVIEAHSDANLPLDVIHADIDHMDGKRDFTFSKENFPDFGEFVKTKQKDGLKFITILDPALKADDNDSYLYLPFKRGFEEDIYIKWAPEIPVGNRSNPTGVDVENGIIYGRVWPDGAVAFPDFMKINTSRWWKEEIHSYWNDIVKADGIWLDMNEPANFETNLPDGEDPFYCSRKPTPDKCWNLKCPEDEEESNTFIPELMRQQKDNGQYESLATKTLCMQSVQGENGEFKFPDVHSLYGLYQTKATYDALYALTDRKTSPLVITRSTFPSSGKYAGHWLGDNRSEWKYLHQSIIGMLEFSLFGIPYTGADICGFFGNADQEMCGRWMQLGAFYPFMRNHNTEKTIEQDPARFLKGTKYLEWSKNALELRYSLIPYLQTLLYSASLTGSTVVRPLFHEFPSDTNTYDMDTEFMWGSALLIAPVLEKNIDSLSIYLPQDDWYDFHTKIIMPTTGQFNVSDLDTPESKIPLFVRGGHIIPLRQSGCKNTEECEKKPFSLHVFPNKDGKAKGIWYKSHSTVAKNKRDPDAWKLDLNLEYCAIEIITNRVFFAGDVIIEDVWVYGQNKSNSPKEIVFDLTPSDTETPNAGVTWNEKTQAFNFKTNFNTKKHTKKYRMYWAPCEPQ